MTRGFHHLVGNAECQPLPLFQECSKLHGKIMKITYKGKVYK